MQTIKSLQQQINKIKSLAGRHIRMTVGNNERIVSKAAVLRELSAQVQEERKAMNMANCEYPLPHLDRVGA